MALIKFKNLPDTSTPINDVNLNNNFENIKILRKWDMDLTALDNSKFYPILFDSKEIIHCEIYSPNLASSASFNSNNIKFLLQSHGWDDIPKVFKLLFYSKYDANEITIGYIGTGSNHGTNCIWLRGGLNYNFYSDTEPILCTETTTISNETFSVGNVYNGGANKNVTYMFNPDDYDKFGNKIN